MGINEFELLILAGITIIFLILVIFIMAFLLTKSIKINHNDLKDLKHKLKKFQKITLEKNNFNLDTMKEEVLKHNGNDHEFLKRIKDYQRLLNVVYDFEELDDGQNKTLDEELD